MEDVKKYIEAYEEEQKTLREQLKKEQELFNILVETSIDSPMFEDNAIMHLLGTKHLKGKLQQIDDIVMRLKLLIK